MQLTRNTQARELWDRVDRCLRRIVDTVTRAAVLWQTQCELEKTLAKNILENENNSRRRV